MGLFSKSITAPASFADGKKRRIVILGGGYAGVDLAQKLEAVLTNSPVEILIIEKRDQFHHAVASIRGVTEKGFAKQIWVPYDKAFKTNLVTVKTGVEVTTVAAKSLTTTTGEIISFDYLAVCTGSWNPEPGKYATAKTAAEAIANMEKLQSAVSSPETKSILIVGGGVVGCEIAGDIATDFPGKKVTVVEAGPKILGLPQLTEKVRASVTQQLTDMGVTIITGDKVNLAKDDFSMEWKGAVKRTITTEGGKSLESDLQIIAIGNFAFNSTPLAGTFPNLIDPKTKEIIVKQTLQVADPSVPWIFSLGDVAKVGGSKTSVTATGVVPIAVDNIVALLAAEATTPDVSDPAVRAKVLSSAVLKDIPEQKFAMVIMLGRNGGVGQLPMFGTTTLGPFLTKNIKSKTAFTPMYRAKMGY